MRRATVDVDGPHEIPPSPALVAPLLALVAALTLAPAAFADVAPGGDTTGGTILFWLIVLTIVGIVIGTVVLYVDRRRRR